MCHIYLSKVIKSFNRYLITKTEVIINKKKKYVDEVSDFLFSMFMIKPPLKQNVTDFQRQDFSCA